MMTYVFDVSEVAFSSKEQVKSDYNCSHGIQSNVDNQSRVDSSRKGPQRERTWNCLFQKDTEQRGYIINESKTNQELAEV